MSKRLKEVLAGLTQMSLVTNVNCDRCEDFHGTLSIVLLDQDEHGNTTSASDTRYVKVTDSRGNCEIYKLDVQNGVATLELTELDAVQLSIVQVDEHGQQMIDGDTYAIMYIVNGEIREEDYAKHTFTTQHQSQQLQIINQPRIGTQLHICKAVFDEYRDLADFDESMNFTICLYGMGIEKFIDLNVTNQFQITLENLPMGHYQIEEEQQACFDTYFRFDNGEETQQCDICLEEGYHELVVMNVKRPQSILTIDKYIRDMNGELMKPQDQECFQVRVIGDYFDDIFTLDACNGFSVDVLDLPPGCYDVCELDNDIYDVTYLVNSERECEYAHVEVRECDCASVMVISNPRICCAQDSPLRICKYVRRGDGCLVKPDACQNFKVMLSGCGVCQTFNLNACNNFCVDIDHICCGEYEIRELDHEDYVCSYMINDGCESTSACICVHEGTHHCVTLINEERNKGQVNICKYIKDACGDLVKPDGGMRFVVTLRSFFCRETLVLDESNDFCIRLCNLKEGSYEVRENCVDGFETSYIVNGCKERHARFIVENGCYNEIKIVNEQRRAVAGNLHIQKFMESESGEYVKPAADEEFEVEVSGPCLQSCYSLKASNNWSIILEGLEIGTYRVKESPCSDFTTAYYVNGSCQEEAMVCIGRRDEEVSIVNTRRNFGNLKLSAMIRNCDGELGKPWGNASFEILVENSKGSHMYTLDACNNYCILLDDMTKGKYRIIQKDSFGYKVSYDVDGEEMNHGVAVMDGCNVNVTIINTMMQCAGIVRLKKWIETSDGNLVLPCPQDMFTLRLKGHCCDQEVRLHRRNDFFVFFDDLEEGNYEICEEHCDAYDVRFLVNGCEQEQGCFTLGRDDIEIEIINQEREEPTVCISKRLKIDNVLCEPDDCDCYSFLLKGRNVHEVYELNAQNDFCICLEGLCNQHYEIREIGDCHAMYQIDDCLQSDGYFLFQGNNMEITIINEDITAPLIEIKKVMQDENGEEFKPCREDHFDIVVEGDCYKQCFTLEYANDWCVPLYDLACGEYEVRELCDEYEVSYCIAGHEEDCGKFCVDDKDSCITIINRPLCHNELSICASQFVNGEEMEPSRDQVYEVNIAMGNEEECHTLNCANNWCLCLRDIRKGCYRIQVINCENIIYEIDECCFENCIEVAVDNQCTAVKLLEDMNTCGASIEISKWIQNDCGELEKPQRQQSFEVRLCGEGETCYTLNCKNNWCVCINDAMDGDYEVIELGGGAQTSYQINDGRAKRRGCFTVCGNDVNVSVINEEETRMASLTLHAMVKNCDGGLEVPPMDARFDVMIDGHKVQEDITLQHRNGFMMIYRHLPKGRYTITQKPNDAYDQITYRVNGEEQSDGCIILANADVQVDTINYMNCERGSISIMKYKQDESCGCLKRPSMNDEYDVKILGENFQQAVVLNASNKWSYLFDDLLDGTYVIKETSEENVSYIINGGKEVSEAIVVVTGNDAHVKIINHEKSSINKGSIEVCKLMKDEEGCYHYPDANDAYWVNVSGNGETQRILLQQANHFFVEVRGLADGLYEVSEEGGNAVYTINGGSEQKRAKLQVHGNNNSVNVINSMGRLGSITMRKYVQSEDGLLMRPTGNEAYRIHISRPGFNTVVMLDNSNDFQTILRDLAPGMYVIDELDHENVTFIIDGGSQVDRAIVNVDGRNHDVKIINSQQGQGGSIALTKYLRQNNGQLMRPSGDDRYNFHISKPGYNEVFGLDASNNWSLQLNALEDGNYVIVEVDNDENVTYIINQGSETNYGIVNVMGNTNTVQAINAILPNEGGSITLSKYVRQADGQVVRPSGGERYNFHISKPGYNEVFVLDASNDFTIQLDQLADGNYVIVEIDDDENVTYIINDGSETNYGIVNVMGNANIVQAINASLPNEGGSITLSKFIRQSDGQVVRPSGDARYNFYVSKPGYNETFVLDRDNDWMITLEPLADGDYVIVETNMDEQVTYIINDGSERDFAIVSVAGNANAVQAINVAHNETGGSMMIQKFVRNSQGELVTPPYDYQARLHISKPGYNDVFTLQQSNNFTVSLSDLQDGMYVLNELDNQGNVSWRINGGNEVRYGIVNVSGNANSIEMINALNNSQGSIQISKLIRNSNGQLLPPQSQEQFQVAISGETSSNVVLNAMNNWISTVTGLNIGTYQVQEQGTGSYDISYIVNDGEELSNAMVEVDGGEQFVTIINTPRIVPTMKKKSADIRIVIE